MKRFFKVIGYIILGVIGILLIGFGIYANSKISPERTAKKLVGEPAPNLTVDGQIFRDLNKNNKLDFYEDSRRPIDERVEDILSQMTVEEKAGMFFHTFTATSNDGQITSSLNPMNMLPAHVAIFEKNMNFFNLFFVPNAENTAKWTNNMQRLAEKTRLGIPITFSTDPRHTAFETGATIGFYMDGFSHWCEPIGFGAIGDSTLTQRFGEIAAKEYRAIGIHTALHPMADLATEPRWGRISGTFGEDAILSGKLTAAYIRGFQGDSMSTTSVSCMTKHFSGGGPQTDGWDAHFKYGKDQSYHGGNFDYHVLPFREAITVGTSQMMPYYGIPQKQTNDDVGFGFNKYIITDLLYDSLEYDGIVCTDWQLITGASILGKTLIAAKDHGVEDLTPVQKVKKAIDAGCDQFGGEASPEWILELVEKGEITEERLDKSIRKLLRLKFELGLFDNPFVDEQEVIKVCGTGEAMKLGHESQIKAQTLLKNKNAILPLGNNLKVYAENIDKSVLEGYAIVVDRVEEADVAILNLKAPFEPRKGLLESMIHQGRLYYLKEELEPIIDVMSKKTTIITMYMERPAVIPEIIEQSAGLIANFGASDKALLEVIFGIGKPEGKLPFEMPSTWEAAENQKEDVPYDSKNPAFEFGFGLQYE